MALSADYKNKRSGSIDLAGAHVKASTTVYGGSLVNRLTATGLIQPASDVASVTFAGVSMERVAGNAAGTSTITLARTGVFEFAYSAGDATEAVCGSEVEIKDDCTVQLAATSTNHVKCGIIEEFVSASKVRVRIDGYCK